MSKRIDIDTEFDTFDEDLEDKLLLGFIKYVGDEDNGYHIYEFIFTDNIDEFWGENFEYSPCCMINDLVPNEEYITETKIVKSPFEMNLIQDSCCFGFQDCADGICSIGYAYDDSDNLFLNFKFGDDIISTEEQLAHKGIIFE